MLFNNRDCDSKQRFSIRKLSVGVCSVLLSTLFLTTNNVETVHADETNVDKDNTATAINNSASTGDINQKVVPLSSSTQGQTSESDSKNHETVNTDTKKTDDQKLKENDVQEDTDNTAQQDQTEQGSNKPVNDKEGQQSTQQVQKDIHVEKTKNNVQSTEDTKETTQNLNVPNQTNTGLLPGLEKALRESKAAENLAPDPYTQDDGMSYIMGTDIASHAASFLKNGQKLLEAGAKITWETPLQTPTQSDFDSNPMHGKVSVTLNGTTSIVDVAAIPIDQPVKLNGSAKHRYYYINNVGDKGPDSATQKDAQGMVLYDPNGKEENNLLAPVPTDDSNYGFTYKYKLPDHIDTSSMGIKFLKIEAIAIPDEDNKDYILDTGAVIINVPYLVKDLPLQADTNQPVYVQKGDGDNGDSGYLDLTQADGASANSSGFGRYFYGTASNGYQDYALAYALGIGAVSNFNNASGDNKDATSMQVWINVPNAEKHTFQVVQVTPDEVPAGKPLYIFKHGGNPNVGPNKIVNTLKDQTTYVQNDLLNPITPAGAVFAGTGAEATSKADKSSDDSNHYTFQYTAYYGGFNKSGNTQIPLLSNTSKYASQEFIDEIAKTYQTLGFNNEWATTGISDQVYAPAEFKNRAGDIYIIDQPEANQMGDNVCDVTNGPSTLTNPDDIAKFIQAPATLDGKWPTGTTFEWVDKDGKSAAPLTFTQAGQTKTGYIKVHLAMPDGMTSAQQGWWYDHIVQVQAISKAKTINPGQDVAYGTPLSAADLVTNKDQFPAGTTFHYASRDADGHLCYQNNDGKWVYDVEQPDGTTQQVEATGEVKSTEPNWTKGGEYANVGIYADYTLTALDGSKKQVQSTPTLATVTIDRYVNYYVVEGGKLPTDPSSLVHFDDDLVKEDPLEFSAGFTQVGSDAAAQLSNQKSNQAQFTVHFKNSNTTVKLYLNVIVIPKIAGVSDQWFNANGSHNQTIDTAHQTGDYTIANGQAASQLTDYTDADGSYQGYQFNKDNSAEGGSFSQTTEAYQPGMTVTGLSTNSANELTGGKQTVTVRIDVPKGTHGGNGVTILTDEKGNSYYNLEVPINVVFSGNITVTGKQTVTYNADQQSIDQRRSDKYVGTIVISNPSADSNLKVNVELTNADLQFVDAHGNPTIAPTNAGTYHVGLRKSGIQKVKAAVEAASAQSPYKYDVSYDTTKFADFIVNKADGKAIFTGKGTKTYDGSAIADYKPSVTIAAQGVDPDTKVDLIAGTDYVWYLTDEAGGKIGDALTTAPVDAGNYIVELTDAGKSKITSLNAANVDWKKPGAITESASYIINKATAPITFVTQDGQSITKPDEFNLANYQVKVGIPGAENYQLTYAKTDLIFIDKDGIQWQQIPSAPGSYQVELSNLAISKVKAYYDKYSKNYNFVNEAYSMLNIDAASAQISFVDTENNDRLVGKAQMITGPAGATIEFTGANALKFDNTKYELVPGQQDKDSVKLGAEGTNTPVTIKLKHKHKKEIIAKTLTFTVDYKYANGDQAGQQAADSVQWAGFFSRIKDTDLVTNVETFTDWQFDPSYNKDGFTNGYKVISGNWSAPEDGKVTVIDTPNVNGYIAFTNADGTNANQFNIASPKGDETHTVYYAQVQTDPRTVTAEFHFWKDNKDAGTAAPSAELQVFFKKAPTNVRVDALGQIHVTYGNWEWDKAAGDPQTPGIHVISGEKLWNNVNDAQGGFSVNAPNVDKYTPIKMREDSLNTTVNFSSPILNSDTLFTNDTDGTWYNRNRLVTFYVPNTDLNRTSKRTIEVHNPDGTITKIPQEVTFSRTAKVNQGAGTAENPGDTAVVFTDFTPTNGTWADYDVAKNDGYKTLIDGHEVAGNKIPSVTVTPDTKDTTVKVTYTASATATLTGSASSEYTGSPITWDDVNDSNIKVKITGPTAGSYELVQGDTEFSSNGTDWSTALPTNAGIYQIRWTEAGIDHIKAKFGNSSITWGDNNANIISNAAYTIKAATVDVTLSGSGTKVYDGQPVSTAELNNTAQGGQNNIHATIDVTINGVVTKIDYILQDGDYKWVDYPNPDGSFVTNGQAPTNVIAGNDQYHIQLDKNSQVLADHITAAILAQNPALKGNFTFDVAHVGDEDVKFTIVPAPAKLEQAGQKEQTYNGQAASVTLQELLDNLKASLVNGQPLYDNDKFNDTALTLDDFDWYNGDEDLGKVSDTIKAPLNAGHYTIKLNQDGRDKVAGWGDENYNPNYSFLTGPEDNQEPNYSGAFRYDITQAPGTVSIKNTTEDNYAKVYDGQPTNSVDMSKLTVTAADGTTAVIDFRTSGLTDADFVFTDAQGNVLPTKPTATGTYYIKLTATGLAQLNTVNPNYKLTYDNSLATYKITQADLTVEQNGSSEQTYTGNALSPELSDVLAHLTATASLANGESLNTTSLTLADFNWTAKTNAGQYTLALNAAGLKKLQDNNKNYNISSVAGSYTFTINKADGKAAFSGTGTKTYDDSAIADYQPTVTVTAPGTASSVDLTAGTDYVWYLLDADGNKTGAALTTAPASAGKYTVELTTAGKGKITALNADNINWKDTDITGTGSYIINKATATVNFAENSGQTVDYSGQTGKFDVSKFEPTISTNNEQTLNIPDGVNLSLAAGDFTINGVETTTEPVELGTYTIGLSKSGFAKLQSVTNNYNWVNSAKASYIIKTNDKATITVTNNVADGGHQTVVYKGSAYNANNIDLADYALTLPTGLTYHLQAGDLELVGDPTNVGTCTVQLSEQGKTNLQKAAGDKFIFDFNKEGVANSTASFEITKATPTVVFGGTGSKTYGQNDETWTKPADLTITNAPGMGNETISLANSDYEFVGQDGTVYSSVPTNVGTYTVRLSDQGKAKVTGSTINAGNLDWAKAAISGEGSFTVKAAEASAALSGANNRDYNGSAVSTADINNGGNIVVTISIPGTTNTISYKLADGDYTWKDNADPINVGTYTIELNKANILAHLQAQIANDPAWKGNVTLAAAKLSGNATFTINQKAANVSLTGNNDASVPPYSGKAATMPVDALKNALTNSDNLDLSGLTADGFDWYDAAGTTKIAAPTNAGSYTIKLNDTGLSEIQTKNSNYKVSIATPNNYGFKIKKVNGHVVLNNNATDAFTGVANNDVYKNYTLTLSTDTPVTDQIGYTLKPGDLQFLVNGTWTSNVPTAVGKYEVRLGQTGWDNLKKSLNNNSQNINWVATDTPKDKNYYTITAASATANLAGQNSMVYNGQAPTANDVNGGTIEVTLTFPGATDANKVFKLTDASYYTWNTSDHTNVGNYTITLTNAGKTAIQNYIDSIVGEGNITLPTDKVTGSAKFDITPAQLTVEQGGNGSKTYDGKAANVGTTNLTNKNNWSVTGMMGGESFNIPATLTKTDFDWYQVNADGSETKLNGVPTNAGNYAIKLNAAGLTKLNAANKNYNIASDKLSGKYSYTINKANAVISLDSTANKQDATWTGSTIAVDPTNFVPSIKDTSNNKTIALPNVQLTADDYTVAGNPVEPGSYNVTLTENGWKKVADAVSGTDNYNWSYSGNGILTIAKKQQAITISGSQTVIYSGDPAVLPTNADGTLKGYTVDLGNGLTYQLKAGDLEFVQAAHTDAGTYKLKLSAAGLENIKKLASGDHYDYSYTYDETNNSAELIVAKATATYELNGGQSSTYDGNPVSIDLNKDNTYSITITMNNGQQVTYQLTTADLAFKSGSAPTARGRYDVVLSSTGLDHLKALNANYNWDTDKSTSTAYYEINPAEMFVGIGGTTHTVYNGQVQHVPADELSDLHLIWGGSETKPSDTTSIQLQAGDFDYYQKNADGTFSKVDPKDAKTYYLVLNQAGLDRLNAANPNGNYTFELNNDPKQVNYGTYTINQLNAKVTLTGSQSAEYGYAQDLDVHNFHIVLRDENGNQIIEVPDDVLASGDLLIKNYAADKHPADVGTYDVEIQPSLIEKLKQKYTDFNFDPVTSRDTNSDGLSEAVVQKNNDGKYIITTVDAYISISGSQTVPYNADHSYSIGNSYSVTLKDKQDKVITLPDDIKSKLQFQFVASPTNAGNYEVTLTPKSISLIETIGANNFNGEDNYAWHSNIQPQSYVVTPLEVTANVANAGTEPASSIYGESINLDDHLGAYTITLTDKSTNKPITYTLQKGDLVFVTEPTNVGTYEVQLSQAGINHIQEQYPTQNYTITYGHTATFKVTAATPTITITANGKTQKTYDANPAEIKPGDFTVSITTNNGQTIDYQLSGSDLQFDGNAPTDAGQYEVKLKPSVIDKLKQQFPNYNWDADSVTNAAGKFTITAANGSAVLSGNVSKSYDGSGISDLSPIKVTVDYPGVGTNTTYTLTNDDYVIVNDSTGKQYKPSEAPANVGDYHIELTQTGKDNIAKLGNSKQHHNINWTADSFTGNATYKISAISISVSGKGKQTATYDGTSFGNADKLDLSKFVSMLNANGVKVPTIPANTLTDGDYTIKNSNDETVTDPTDAGEYTVWLNEKGLNKLKSLSSNFTWSAAPIQVGTLTINPFEVTVTIKGNAEVDSGVTAIPDHTYSFDFTNKENSKWPEGWKQPTISVSDLDFDGSRPAETTKNGTFTVNYKGGQAALQKLLGNNYKVTYVAGNNNFVVAPQEHTGKISYIDPNDPNKEIGSTPLKGKTGDEIKITPAPPAGWKVVPDQDIPTTVTVTKDGIPTITVKVEHDTIVVTPDDPKTPNDKLPDTINKGPNYPGNNYPAGVAHDDLNKTITRTIIEKLPSGDKKIEQIVTFTRTATIDLVTGKVSHGEWTKSGSWDKFTAENVPGYTANPKQVEAEDVTIETNDKTVTINYTRDAQPTTPGGNDGDGDLPTPPTPPANPDQGSGDHGGTTPPNPSNPVQPSGGSKPDEKPSDKPGNKPGKPTKPEEPGKKPTKPNNPSKSKPTKSNKTKTTRPSQTITKAPGKAPKKGRYDNVTPPNGSDVPNGLPAGTHWKNAALIGPNGEVYYKNGHWSYAGRKALPQTGAHDNVLATVFGSLAAGLGILGLFGVHKKKKDE